MKRSHLWLRFTRLVSRLLGKFRVWPPGYVRYRLRGNARSLKIFSHLTLAEKLFLYTTALSLPRGSVFAEIGSYLGASACFLAAAALERKGKVYCVDTWQNDAMSEGQRNTWAEFKNNIKPYQTRIVPIRAQSVNAAAMVFEVVDLLFVDGDHSYDGVKADLDTWLPKMRDGGWVILHDYGWAEGVKRAVAEVVRPIEAGPAVILPNLYAVQVRSIHHTSAKNSKARLKD